MKLSNQAITEFKSIYQSKFGIDLTDDEANLKGLEVLDFFRYIYRRVPVQDQLFLESLDNNIRALERPMYNTRKTINNNTIG
jgi:hypothetical protein